MATLRQKKLAQAIIENTHKKKPANKAELLVSVGYSQKVATKKPQEIIEQKGVKIELEKLGFSALNAKSVIAEIMNNPIEESQNRLKAADMTLKVLGEYAAEKHITVTRQIRFDD